MGIGWDPTSYTLSIFDRWGVQIFNTNDVTQGWDATYKGLGEKVQVDVYTWKVDLKDVFHKQHNYIGHVSVLK
jgi:gliding motility-associated-like protein